MSNTIVGAGKVLAALIFALMLPSIVVAQTLSPPGTTAQASTAPQSTAQTPRRPTRKIQPPLARVTVIPSQSQVAPQVVTIVHRLSGIKILRLLLRQSGESGIVETIDPGTITNDAHASIFAGWALDDGRIIAARLPQAAAEIEFTELVESRAELKARAAAGTPPLPAPRVEPDLTVITGDGRKFRAHLIGLDAETGMSVLQVNAPIAPASVKELSGELATGQRIQIFAPEQTTPENEALSRITYVKVGKMDVTVSNLAPTNFGVSGRLTLRGEKLSPVLIGGIACDRSGNTIGIVESIEGNDARVISADTIRAATRRVLDRQASVPRPLLGVRGEPVEFAARAAFLAHGWRDDQLQDLINEQVGILLTSVMPRTPAALAKLQPGDVILRVDKNEVKTAEEFSKLLGDAGSGEQVEFTVRRPDVTGTMSVPVKLGGSFASTFDWRFEMPRVPAPFMGLESLGLETMALTPRVALQLGAQNGLIVVAVKPDSAAARGGVLEGDVIESIDGRVAGRGVWTTAPQFARQKKHTLSIVREREKKKVVLEIEE